MPLHWTHSMSAHPSKVLTSYFRMSTIRQHYCRLVQTSSMSLQRDSGLCMHGAQTATSVVGREHTYCQDHTECRHMSFDPNAFIPEGPSSRTQHLLSRNLRTHRHTCAAAFCENTLLSQFHGETFANALSSRMAVLI